MAVTSLVITSIAEANSPVLRLYADECGRRDIPFIVIGDSKSPDSFSLPGCSFWSLQDQASLDFKIIRHLPEGHYARKNIGYLIAWHQGADTIIETDDDNFPRPIFWKNLQRSRNLEVKCISRSGWINVYRYFSDSNIWPRGLPLTELNATVPDLSEARARNLDCPIQQGLADDNPDVDAIYRMTMPLPQSFKQDRQVALDAFNWCPFNSQNTLWFREAAPLMYLPAFCSFRMTDIWRSLIAQRIAWNNDWHVLFHSPTVYQERNEHDLLKDFEQEIPGYLQNQKIIEALSRVALKPGVHSTAENLLICYDVMIENGWVAEEEAALVHAWVEDISAFS